jgi:hypothetical protein
MTHLEKKRVEYLMDNSKMTFAAAKTQAQTEIMKIFNIENVTLGNSETLDISKSGDGNAVLLAISAILQSDKTEAELTELLSTINTDIRTDGTLDSTNTKATLVTAMEYLKSRRSTIRSNIESRYSNLGISATIPAFESYAFKLDITAPTVSSSTPADSTNPVAIDTNISMTFSEVMDNSTITTNTVNTSCSGTLQVSSDNFSNCIQMSSLTVSNSNKTFTVTPSLSLSYSTTYKIRVTTGVKDIAGNTLSSQYETSSGFVSTTLPYYVVVGNSGKILTRPLVGTSWTTRTSGTSSNLYLYGVTYGNGLYVAVGTTSDSKGSILTSSDGISWTSSTSDVSTGFRGAAYGNSTFVIVGHDGKILTSSNGTSWTARTSGRSTDLYGITYGNNIFVAVGKTSAGNISNSIGILTSSDGTSWDNRTHPTSSSDLHGATYGNSTFVVTGESGIIFTSSDGTTWTKRTSDVNAWFHGVTYGNSTFVIVTDSAYVLTSSNGTTWDDSNKGSSMTLWEVTYGNNIFVAVGPSGILTSSNGTSWTYSSGTSNWLRGVTFKE